MEASYRGLALAQSYDFIFGTPLPNHWWVIHNGTGRTVIGIEGSWAKADKIAKELACLRDWSAIDDWDETEVARFAGKYLIEVEVPRYIDDPSEWDADVPYGDAMAS